MPQIFRAKARPKARTIRPQEPSPHHKGYDGRWRRYSERLRRKNPFCARCRETDRMTLVVLGRTGVVDHKWPVAHGGPFWEPSNHWVLCNACHSGWKARLEEHWRAIGGTGPDIVRWCDEPASRPRFRGDV